MTNICKRCGKPFEDECALVLCMECLKTLGDGIVLPGLESASEERKESQPAPKKSWWRRYREELAKARQALRDKEKAANQARRANLNKVMCRKVKEFEDRGWTHIDTFNVTPDFKLADCFLYSPHGRLYSLRVNEQAGSTITLIG